MVWAELGLQLAWLGREQPGTAQQIGDWHSSQAFTGSDFRGPLDPPEGIVSPGVRLALQRALSAHSAGVSTEARRAEDLAGSATGKGTEAATQSSTRGYRGDQDHYGPTTVS